MSWTLGPFDWSNVRLKRIQTLVKENLKSIERFHEETILFLKEPPFIVCVQELSYTPCVCVCVCVRAIAHLCTMLCVCVCVYVLPIDFIPLESRFIILGVFNPCLTTALQQLVCTETHGPLGNYQLLSVSITPSHTHTRYMKRKRGMRQGGVVKTKVCVLIFYT